MGRQVAKSLAPAYYTLDPRMPQIPVAKAITDRFYWFISLLVSCCMAALLLAVALPIPGLIVFAVSVYSCFELGYLVDATKAANDEKYSKT